MSVPSAETPVPRPGVLGVCILLYCYHGCCWVFAACLLGVLSGTIHFSHPPPAWSSIKGLPRKIPRSGVEGSGVFLLSTFSVGAGGTPQFLLRRRSGLCVFWMKTSSSPLCTGSWQLLRRTCSCVLWQRTEQLLWASGELVSPGISAEEFAPYYHWNPH